MLVAFFSPLNPAPTGISDYSEELLPPLADCLAPYAEIELVVDASYGELTNRALKHFPQRSLNEFHARASRYDVILYHMGNSPAHAGIYETLLKFPGVVVMHDVVLHHLRAWLTLERGNRADYLAAMKREYGEAGERAAWGEIGGRALADRFEFPLNENVARAARALIVHSDYAARQLQPLAPKTPLAVIPMGIEIPNIMPRDSSRATLQLARDEFVIAMFGDAQPNKRVLPALEAFAKFRARFPDSRFVLVGRVSPLFDVRGATKTLGIADAVDLIGYAPRETYDAYIAAADLCLNLRYPTAGETSASLLRLFAAEKACIVTDTGAFSDLPDATCVKVRADEREEKNLCDAFEFFARDARRGMRLGKFARAFVEQGHTLEIAARAYADFLRAVIEERATSCSYIKAWTPPRGFEIDAAAISFQERVALDAPNVDAGETWGDELARACADLGIRDDARLRDVVSTLRELGLSSS